MNKLSKISMKCIVNKELIMRLKFQALNQLTVNSRDESMCCGVTCS
ncbi:hypothetical protein Cal7507_0175 [Calothrix sp. PCC 7507]|nr:hypothetical protein Cal7507_0175 [Calothrix sp. PCC 7507]